MKYVSVNNDDYIFNATDDVRIIHEDGKDVLYVNEAKIVVIENGNIMVTSISMLSELPETLTNPIVKRDELYHAALVLRNNGERIIATKMVRAFTGWPLGRCIQYTRDLPISAKKECQKNQDYQW